MKKYCIATLFLLFASSAVFAQDYYLELDGIKGDVTRQSHKDWIEILSFEHGIDVPAGAPAGGRQRAGRPQFKEFRVCKDIDRSTPPIQNATSRGRVIKDAKMEVVHNNQVVLRYEFENVRLRNYFISGKKGELPKDCVSLVFEKIKVTYVAQNAQGQPTDIPFEWDVKSGQ